MTAMIGFSGMRRGCIFEENPIPTLEQKATTVGLSHGFNLLCLILFIGILKWI